MNSLHLVKEFLRGPYLLESILSLCSFDLLFRTCNNSYTLVFMGVKKSYSKTQDKFSNFFLSCIPRSLFAVTKATILVIFVLISAQQFIFYIFSPIQSQSFIQDQNRVRYASGVSNHSHYNPGMLSNSRNGEIRNDQTSDGISIEQNNDKMVDPMGKPNAIFEKKSRKLLFSEKTVNRNIKNFYKNDAEYRKLESSRIGQMIKKLSNYLVMARNYLILAQEFDDENFVYELKEEIRKCLALLDNDDVDNFNVEIGNLSLKNIEERISSMEKLIYAASLQPYDTSKLITQLKLKLENVERETRKIDFQSKIYSQIASKSIPMNLHCLSMRLTQEKFTDNMNCPSQRANDNDFDCNGRYLSALADNSLFHYALFSDNIISVAVVVNSTAQNLLQPGRHVFHIVTDKMNYKAMKAWFLLYPPPGIIVEVTCLDDYSWINSSYVAVLQQMENEALRKYYFRSSIMDLELDEIENLNNFKYRNPKYLSILNHLRFYLPEIFPRLNKILFLDDDVVVQKDLSPLWHIDMHDNVNLAVETCGTTFHRFKTYLNFSSPLLSGYDPEGCGWAFGMNMFDLSEWRKSNYTQIYHYWQKQNENRTLWKLGTLPAGLLTFYNKTQPLDRHWQVLGLGSFNDIADLTIMNGAVIHFNGHAKPWLELAILRYQKYWTKYVPYSEDLLRSCNILPP